MSVTLTIVLAEICLVLVAVLLIIGGKALRRRRREQAAVKTLVTSIKEHQSERVEKLAGMLKDSGHLNDEDALGKANELIKKQNRFYQDAIDLYFTRNHEVLSKLDNRIEDLLSQYQILVKVADGNTPTVDSGAVEQLSKDIAALSKELVGLRAENAYLTSQLKAAEHELDQLGQEYVSAFNKPKVSKAKAEDEQGLEPSEADTAADQTNMPVESAQEPEPAAEEPASENGEMPAPTEAPAGGATTDADAVMLGDDMEDKGMLADLDLAELIDDKSGGDGKSAAKS